MVSNVRSKRILATFLAASAVALYAPVPFAAQAPSASRPSLDYEVFKTQVEPIFLKKRWPDHARCYVCHEVSRHGRRTPKPGEAVARDELLDRGAVSRQLSSCLKTGDSRQSANQPVATNAAGAGGGRHRRYPPGREAIYIPGRPGLEDHGGVGSRAKSRRFLRAVAERFRCTPPVAATAD